MEKYIEIFYHFWSSILESEISRWIFLVGNFILLEYLCTMCDQSFVIFCTFLKLLIVILLPSQKRKMQHQKEEFWFTMIFIIIQMCFFYSFTKNFITNILSLHCKRIWLSFWIFIIQSASSYNWHFSFNQQQFYTQQLTH